jgi:ribosomal protein S18 acetylase RimI-like enzyme
MNITINEAPIAEVGTLAGVPISFRVKQVCDVRPRDDRPGEFVLSENPVDAPYLKDYDALPGEGPAQWARQFDLTNWGFIRARLGARLVGGAVIAIRTPACTMLEGRDDLAVLWDIRVAPEVRGQGIGSALFRATEAWAVAHDCRELKVETQNINVPASRFYQRHGCTLRQINRHAYRDLPGEIQLLWYKDLATDGAG